uniref:Maturase K n=1 Tax=Acrostichum speciosum TaxID=366450 RepID=A0A7M1VJE1_9MONI|nr:maturase K [Acrostichum speciosum]QOS04102.1 maturase K [Acrostichum speciosum]
MIALMLGVSLFYQVETSIKETLEISQSIHSIFLFLEDRFPKSQYILKTDLSQNLHLETSIRLFRRQIQDVSFSHLLRIFFYRDNILSKKKKISSRERKKNNISTLFQNFYFYGIDLLIMIPWIRVWKLQVNSLLSIDRHNIIQKEKNISIYKLESDAVGSDSYFIQNLCIHYARYRNKLIIAVEGTHFFAKKWFYYFSTLFNYHFHYRAILYQPHSSQPHLELLSTNCVSFLGYTSIAQLVTKSVCIDTTMGLYISILNKKKFYPRIPILTVTKILAKQKFCNSAGRPVGQLSWAVLTDDQILNRYVQLWQVFYLYYGASINRDKLGQLKYMLQISCDSTLACKHRSTIRFLRRRFNLEKVNQFIVSNKSEHSHTQRVWHLTLVRSVLSKFTLI